MGRILDFLFGKDNNVFNAKGKVQHDLGSGKWDQWNGRFSENPDYDFTKSRGRAQKKSNPKEKSKN